VASHYYLQRRRANRRRFAKEVAKIELHCHLNGSIRMATLIDLAQGKLSKEDMQYLNEIQQDTQRSLITCFKIFDLIYKVITTTSDVKRILRELLEDFIEDGVHYVEIRTTPRALKDCDKRGYITLICEEIQQFKDNNKIDVRLIIGVDRSKSVEEAKDTLQILYDLIVLQKGIYQFIVGMDLAGNPLRGQFDEYQKIFKEARELLKLKITIHVAEIQNREDESNTVLIFNPDRLGHALCLKREHINVIEEQRIPIEICPTSNMKTLGLQSLSQHPTLKLWIKDNHPFCLSTDDAGVVFDTMPSNELALVANSRNWSITQMAKFCEQQATFTFLSDEGKKDLYTKVKKHNDKLLNQV